MNEPLQTTIGHQHVSAGGQTLAVAPGGRVGRRVGRVVHQGQQRSSDVLAQPVGKQRPTLLHRLAAEGSSHDSQELGADPRIQHHSHPTGGRLYGPQHPGGSLGCVGGGLLHIEVSRLPPQREPEAGLRLAILFSQRIGREEASGLPARRQDPGRGGHGALRDGVRVIGRLHAADARVGGPGPAFQIQGQSHLGLGRMVNQRRPVEVQLSGLHAVRLSQGAVLVRCGERQVVPGLGQNLGQGVWI